MSRKTPANFSSHDEWFSYVREHIPTDEQAYVLACGRTDLFKLFYEARKQTFPIEFMLELEHIQSLQDPERTSDLESLNKLIFANLTDLLFNQAQAKEVETEVVAQASPREQIQELHDHLTQKNRYFALWIDYKKAVNGNFTGEDWNDYLCQRLRKGNDEEIAFTRAMVELDKILLYLYGTNLPLPKYFFERIWFLHLLRGPERMLQTRALLNTLTVEIEVCTSA